MFVVLVVTILFHAMLTLSLLKSFNKVKIASTSCLLLLLLLFSEVGCLLTFTTWGCSNVIVVFIWSVLMMVWIYNIFRCLVLAIVRRWRKRGRRSPFSLKVRMNVFNSTQFELFTLACCIGKFLMNRCWQDLRLLNVTVLFSSALFLAVRCNSKLVRELQSDLFVYRRFTAT